jgi:hypothetical protein
LIARSHENPSRACALALAYQRAARNTESVVGHAFASAFFTLPGVIVML